MIEVEIRNFQAIDRLKLKIQGFTAVVGRSNIGKSSIVRALKCALTGASGQDFIRHDPETCSRLSKNSKKCKCTTSVEFKMEDGRRLLWEKGESTTYTAWDADGTKSVYSNVGQSADIPFLNEGFTKIDLGRDEKRLLQVSDQFKPIYLLDTPGTIVADVLSDVAKLDDINKAMRLVSKERKAATSTRKVRDSDIKVLESKLEAYSNLDSTLTKVGQVREVYKGLHSKEQKVQEVQGFIENFVRVGSAIKALRVAVEPEIPEVDPLGEKSRSYEKAASLYAHLEDSAKALKRLRGVSDLEVPDATMVQDLSQKVAQAGAFYRDLEEDQTTVEALKGLETLDDPQLDVVAQAVKTWGSVAVWYSRLLSLKTTLLDFKAVEKADVETLNPEALKQTYSKVASIRSLYARLETLEAEIEATSLEHEEAIADESEALEAFAELGVCPTCNQGIGPKHKH